MKPPLDAVRRAVAKIDHDLAAARNVASVWKAVNAAVGSRNGDRFQRFAQGVTLDLLVELANNHLRVLKPRYRIRRAVGQELGLHVVDLDMGEEVRSTRSLSGGERFLVSLALALALSGLEGRQSFVDTLFVDEGFGSLDAESLDIAIDALETLQGHGRTVGVISHVDRYQVRSLILPPILGVIKLLGDVGSDRFSSGDISLSGFGITLLQKCQAAGI